MSAMLTTARSFFDACETGQGWAVCQTWCRPDATFASQAEALDGITTLAAYTDWMKGLLTVLTDGAYAVKSFAEDTERHNVSAFAVFTGTHLSGGPVPPTGKSTAADYVYVMSFDGDRIAHMTKIWNSSHTLKELGWA